jgi:hypothetical protein
MGVTAAGAIVIASVLPGCGLPPWCKAQLCTFAESAKALLARRLEAMCAMPADQRAEELRKIGELDAQLTAKFGEALGACTNDNRNLFNDLMKKLWELLEKQRLLRLAGGNIVNEMPMLGSRDSVQLLAIASLCGGAEQKTVTVIELAGKKYLPAALGKAAERMATTSQQLVSARVISAGDAEAPKTFKYCISSPAMFSTTWCSTTYTMELGGSVEFTGLTPLGDGRSAGIPTDIQFDVNREDFRAHLMLDTTFPDNQVIVNADGSGKIMAAVNISGSGDGIDMAIEKSPFSTAWIEIPIRLSPDGLTMTIGSSTPIAGVSLFPVSNVTLLVMTAGGNNDGNSLPPAGSDPCGDHDGDGMLNIVERYLHPMNCQLKKLGCEGYDHITNCP